ncbi:methylcrotonoyl-CoA carboxylase beta chain, mitochondrial-like [Anneissia japonica]|uniref:methylcrotonoyl-CoA carboxylase beta chain, mitochondrial-like n=1 Tax=Anneissia japonica TaxID=1529436 RepID=UPI0014256667|nr:methylcrotonoyl-CoA carboxylase beta chain, mitochondrial-like [Anneissia japonica]
MFSRIITDTIICNKCLSKMYLSRHIFPRKSVIPARPSFLSVKQWWWAAVHGAAMQISAHRGDNGLRPSSKQESSNQTQARTKYSNFKVLDGGVDKSRNSIVKNKANSEKLEEFYCNLMSVVYGGGGARGMKQHIEVNKKMFVRDRIRCLLDDEDFLELSPLAGQGMSYGDIPAAGMVNVVGKICGHWCTVSANDATVKGGTVYPIGVKKQLRVQEISLHNRLPSVYLVDSGGAFLPLQDEIFPDKEHGGRTFYNEAIMSSLKIPQVAIVCGSCTAGGAYVPSMADEAVMVHRIGTIFLGGPPLVHAAIGERVSAEELGGATVHCSVSGVADHFAETEHEAFEVGRNIIETLNEPYPDDLKHFVEPIFPASDLPGLAPRHCYDQDYNPYKILARIVDGSKFQEFKQKFGPALVTGFATIQGTLVGMIANNGHLSYEGALKGAHFVEICCQRKIPIIFLQNTIPEDPEIDGKLDSESLGDLLRARAKMVAVVACAAVPKISVVVGGSFGLSSFAMCGRSFDPRFHFLWPNAQIGLANQNDVTNALIKDKLSKKGDLITSEDKEKFSSETAGLVQQKMSAFYSSSRLNDDGIILPKDTRNVLAKCLNIVSQQKEGNDTRYGVIRM